MSSRFGNNKFKARLGLEERPQNTRTEKKVKGEIPLLAFSFKDFDSNQCPPGQTFPPMIHFPQIVISRNQSLLREMFSGLQ